MYYLLNSYVFSKNPITNFKFHTPQKWIYDKRYLICDLYYGTRSTSLGTGIKIYRMIAPILD